MDCLRRFLLSAKKELNKEFCDDVAHNIRPFFQNLILIFTGATPRVSSHVDWDPYGPKEDLDRGEKISANGQPYPRDDKDEAKEDLDSIQSIWAVASSKLRDISPFGHLAVCDCDFEDPEHKESGLKMVKDSLWALQTIFHDPHNEELSSGLNAFPAPGPESLYNILKPCAKDKKWALAPGLKKMLELLCSADTHTHLANWLKTKEYYCKDFKPDEDSLRTCAAPHLVQAIMGRDKRVIFVQINYIKSNHTGQQLPVSKDIY